MAADERAHREKLRKEYTRRKRLLEIRKARQGDTADPSLDIDLEEINASLALLDAAAAPKATDEVRAAVGQEHIDHLVIAQVAKIAERQTKSEEYAQDIAATLEQSTKLTQEWRETTGEQLIEIKDQMIEIKDQIVGLVINAHAETRKREWGQRRNFWLSIAAIMLMLIVLWILR